jgi:hypothetical protein
MQHLIGPRARNHLGAQASIGIPARLPETSATGGGHAMALPHFDQIVDQLHRALAALVTGDAEPLKALFSRQDDISLANPFGPPVRGRTLLREPWNAPRPCTETEE